jgi:glycosyltransferase involved in cell wall biosynthesis
VARPDAPRIAVLLPCFNEEKAIAQTIAGFREVLPQAEIYVYDNNSSDRTSEVAAAAGAIVRFEPLRGKGSVVRRMFADIDADFYVMADGDATYDAAAAPRMVERALTESLDMVVGCRQTQETAAYRSGHRFGNRLLTNILSYFFGRSFTDILSGYRVFSRRFVKSFPAFASGFEIETEISVHALRMRMPVGEENTAYFARPEGSTSKLSTYRDGFIILSTILNLVRLERPMLFFGLIGALLGLLAFGLSIPIFITYLQTGLVPRFPTVILIASIMLLAFLVAFTGLILDTVVRGRREALRMQYLSLPAFSANGPAAEHGRRWPSAAETVMPLRAE